MCVCVCVCVCMCVAGNSRWAESICGWDGHTRNHDHVSLCSNDFSIVIIALKTSILLWWCTIIHLVFHWLFNPCNCLPCVCVCVCVWGFLHICVRDECMCKGAFVRLRGCMCVYVCVYVEGGGGGACICVCEHVQVCTYMHMRTSMCRGCIVHDSNMHNIHTDTY